MRLRVGADYYEKRNQSDDPGPLWVRRIATGQIGYVTRATPKGTHMPGQAYVMFSTKIGGYDAYEGEWVLQSALEKA